MAYSTIPKGSLYMNTKLYTGNGSTNAITGVGFQPDWTWIKMRSGTGFHKLTDAVRGVTKEIYSNSTAAEFAQTQGLTAFGTDGFTLGTDANYNGNSSTFASWNWKANGAGSANTAGSISSTVSVNTTSGFSIVSYTGTGANATVGHGLGVAPAMMIIKKLNSASSSNWMVYHQSISGTGNGHIWLDLTNSSSTDTNSWNNTAPTPSVFSIGTRSENNGSGDTFIAYCFAEKKGYSKFSSYVGNLNANGTFIYTGFSPAFVMIKNVSQSSNWNIKDNRRNNASTSFNINPRNATLLPNDNAADQDANALDFLSNGFKNRSTGGDVNASGIEFIYMAFAENPFVATSGSTAVPVTAR